MKMFVALVMVFAVAGSAYGAALQVDWLELSGSGTQRSLLTDGAATDGTLSYAVSSGTLFPGHPQNRSLAANSWVIAPDLGATITLPLNVDAFVLRVAPAGGMAGFSLRADDLQGERYVVMIGGMVTTTMGGTSGAVLSTTGGTSVVNYRGGFGYDDGVNIETGGLQWAGGTLSPTGELGESGYGFFEIGFSGGGDRSILIDVPAAYGSGAGDGIVFAFGRIQNIPEPGAMALGLIGMGLVVLRRRRS